MVEFLLNAQALDVATASLLGLALEVADKEDVFDLSASIPDGPAMFMLRNGASAWLMYLREPGDSGFRSSGDITQHGAVSYRLSNGQVDEYPLSWCIDVEQCYKAVAYFCVNKGARPEWVNWVPS